MPGELIPRPMSVAVPRRAQAALRSMVNETRTQQASMRAIEAVTEAAMFEVVQVKRMQRELEQQVPEATEALNLIATSATMAIAHSVQRFSQGLIG